MTEEMLIDSRKKAEAAVADMPEGELRTAAFSVILTHLLSGKGTGVNPGGQASPAPSKPLGGKPASKARTSATGARTGLAARLLGLRDDGFFAAQRSLGEVRDELKKHGWHYPLTSLSGPMQGLVRDRELRREHVAEGEGKKKVWKYSNR
jgi:hypothetical protein